MQLNLSTLESVAPDILAVLQQRFLILRQIYWNQPIGRRILAEKLSVTERVLRSQTSTMRDLSLIEITKSGMTLTDKGKVIFHDLEQVMDGINGLHLLERKLQEHFELDFVQVVAGSSDEQVKVFQDFGQIVTKILHDHLPHGKNIISVMGGTTMSKLASCLSKINQDDQQNLFVPARGGIGEEVMLQANMVSAQMAEKTGGNYRVLYVPERVSPETYQLLKKEPQIKEVLNLIDQSNCVIHSVGRALTMAKRRKMSQEELVSLKNAHAVGESFGYFFDQNGLVVYKLPRLGLQLSQLAKIPLVIFVVGGKNKASAIIAYLKNAPRQTKLIIDEVASREVLRLLTNSSNT